MNKRNFPVRAGLLALGTLFMLSAHAQDNLPPPPPPIGPNGAGPQLIAPPAASPNLNPNAVVQTPQTAAGPTLIFVDAAAKRHAISPLIYGVNFASASQLKALNFTLNRQGGNNYTRYNWQANTLNIDNDYFFESLPGEAYGYPNSLVPGERADSFIAATHSAGAQPMITIPMLGWVAKVVSPSKNLASFSVAKYGPQQKTDPQRPDAGNGIKLDGKLITGNDPNDASQPADPKFQQAWINHLIGKWGKASQGGVRYYLLDNEPGLWHSTHQDVHPVGVKYAEYLQDVVSYTSMIKALDPNAQTLGPEEWGYTAIAQSGFDQQYAGAHNYQGHPDKDANGGLDFMPYLLTQLHQRDMQTKQRLLDVFTFHIYPQGIDGGGGANDVSPRIQTVRNRSTRSLWDPNYTDESWIKNKIMLIPRLRSLVNTYYPGTKIGITEYSWGAEKFIGGATAQADILGIFGREGLDLAARWTTPDAATPTFKAMQMYRNYDGKNSAFGSVSVSDTVPDSDTLSSFASVRRSDGALTVMVINKSLTSPTPVSLSVSHFGGTTASVWQLTSANTIAHLPNTALRGGRVSATLPAQSVTLFVVAAR